MIDVPWREISPETLDALIEEFVTREGTEYGLTDVPLARKVAQVREQLRRSEVCIVFDEVSQSFNLLTRQDYLERVRRAQQD